MKRLKIPYQGYYSDAVQYHVQGSPVTDHQSDPLAVAITCKLCTTGPLKTDGPYHYRPDIFIEFTALVDEYKPPVLYLGVLLT